MVINSNGGDLTETIILLNLNIKEAQAKAKLKFFIYKKMPNVEMIYSSTFHMS